MSNTVRIKRSVSTEAPTTLQNAELAYSESADKLYIGVGTGGAGGSATTILPIGGAGTFLTKTLAASTYAALSSPALLGTPTTPTATAGTSTTQIASTAFVSTAVANLVASSPAALDTLNELATALGNDASFASTVTTSIGTKLAKASNLSDLTNVATARTNLGLGTMGVEVATDYLSKAGNLSGLASIVTSRTNLGLGTMATQAASSVAITGGTIDGVTIDGGTF